MNFLLKYLKFGDLEKRMLLFKKMRKYTRYTNILLPHLHSIDYQVLSYCCHKRYISIIGKSNYARMKTNKTMKLIKAKMSNGIKYFLQVTKFRKKKTFLHESIYVLL